jgi:hypothetical protein
VAPELRARTLETRRGLLAAALAGDLDGIAAGLAGRDGGAVSLAEAARLARRPPAEVEAALSLSLIRLDDGVLAPESALAEAR